ncbi:MAG: hypothetical protein KGI87_00170 [Burkholderiales bacterium]|jgi:hypothetical protein|nr:hypothetical protein [Burkholderiales bacterium]
MNSTPLRLLLAFTVVVGLAGCATSPPPDPAAQVPYCHKTNKGRVIACTSSPAPSLNADAEAKRFTPDPQALTVFVIRRNWGDGRLFVPVRADDGPTIETLPNTMARIRLAPGSHTITFEFEGKRQGRTVAGKAGEIRFLRIEGMAWAWQSSFEWVDEPEAATRARAQKARLVADVARR